MSASSRFNTIILPEDIALGQRAEMTGEEVVRALRLTDNNLKSIDAARFWLTHQTDCLKARYEAMRAKLFCCWCFCAGSWLMSLTAVIAVSIQLFHVEPVMPPPPQKQESHTPSGTCGSCEGDPVSFGDSSPTILCQRADKNSRVCQSRLFGCNDQSVVFAVPDLSCLGKNQSQEVFVGQSILPPVLRIRPFELFYRPIFVPPYLGVRVVEWYRYFTPFRGGCFFLGRGGGL